MSRRSLHELPMSKTAAWAARIAFFALVSLMSIAVSFYSTRLALYVYCLFIVAHFIPGSIDAHLARQPDRRQKDPRQRA